jgi:hypothetical protein
MKPRVYVETTIISYLTAWRSPQLIMAGQQEATRSWWEEERGHFELFISEAVLEEAAAGDAEAAQRRLSALATIPLLEINNKAIELAELLVQQVPIPAKARIDALHVATVHGMDYLITWNCRHIANATLRNRMNRVSESAGYEPPIICTPVELLEGREND